MIPLVYDTGHALSESSEEPLYELGTLDIYILSKSPKKPLYEPGTLNLESH